MFPLINQGFDSTLEPSYFSKTYSDKSGGPELINKTITENGIYNAKQENADGYLSVTVEVTPTLENKSVTPTTSEQTVRAGEDYDGLGTVTVEAVTAAIDANIITGNIKKDVEILGVTGSYEGSGSGGNATLETDGSEFNYLNDYQSLLTAITIPESVTSIGDYAFAGCTSLASVTMSDGVESIGEYAFQYCTSLTDIIIPGSVTSIGNDAFSDCSSLTTITIHQAEGSISGAPWGAPNATVVWDGE